jgi:hypothetical protein
MVYITSSTAHNDMSMYSHDIYAQSLGGSMLDSFQGLALSRGKVRDGRIREMDRLYGLGFVGPNELRIEEDWRLRQQQQQQYQYQE